MTLPAYILDEIHARKYIPLPCEDVLADTMRNYKNTVHNVLLSVRADYPELTPSRIDFYLFDDSESERLGGIDGQFSYLDSRPVIGVRAENFNTGEDEDYQVFLVLHECTHRIQPIEDADENGNLPHNETFHSLLAELLALYNKRYNRVVCDYDLVRTDNASAGKYIH